MELALIRRLIRLNPDARIAMGPEYAPPVEALDMSARRNLAKAKCRLKSALPSGMIQPVVVWFRPLLSIISFSFSTSGPKSSTATFILRRQLGYCQVLAGRFC
jgi:hypothetical protein